MAYLSMEETSAIKQNRSSRERVKVHSQDSIIHSCQCHFIHIYVCLYLQLPLDDVTEFRRFGVHELLELRWQSLARIY